MAHLTDEAGSLKAKLFEADQTVQNVITWIDLLGTKEQGPRSKNALSKLRTELARAGFELENSLGSIVAVETIFREAGV